MNATSPRQLDPPKDPKCDAAPAIDPAHTATPGTAPPHLLWESLESAFAGRETSPPSPDDGPTSDAQPYARAITLPLALGVSLMLWAVIVELVMRV